MPRQTTATVTWDHPRLCGEKDNNPILLFFKEGSPPPMRGKVHIFQIIKRGKGITPAYAGKRSTSDVKKKKDPGSPPPMRGKAGKSQGICQGNRITPAYAGKSVRHRSYPAWTWDHPRLCGEKFLRSGQISD